jgi:hypothetical protein
MWTNPNESVLLGAGCSAPAGGEYRFRFGFSRAAGDHNITGYQVSNPFTVTP